MPVIGHTFAGLAAAFFFPRRRDAINSWGEKIWLPAMLVLAYLPDISGQLFVLIGIRHSTPVSHSLLFALAAAGVAAPFLRHTAGGSTRRNFLLALGAILLHLLLDTLQTPGRNPLWPLLGRPYDPHPSLPRLIPRDIPGEIFFTGAVFLPLTLLAFRRRRAGSGTEVSFTWPTGMPNRRWIIGSAAMLLILGAAASTHELREMKEESLRLAHTLIMESRYQEALEAIDRSEGWPAAPRTGRIGYLRAEAYLGLGDRQKAEIYYLQSYAANPDYFWCLADLALFYARSDAPLEERKQLATPYIDGLRKKFAGHPASSRNIAKIERALGMSGSTELVNPGGKPAQAGQPDGEED